MIQAETLAREEVLLSRNALLVNLRRNRIRRTRKECATRSGTLFGCILKKRTSMVK